MELNAKEDVNCEGMDILMDGWMENQTPILHLAKAGVTKTMSKKF